MNPTPDAMTPLEYHTWMLTRMKALAALSPAAEADVKPLIEHHERQITALTAVDALEKAPTGQLTLGYQKTTYGTMKPRPVQVGSEHRTRTNIPSFPGGPDVRIDPPYDR